MKFRDIKIGPRAALIFAIIVAVVVVMGLLSANKLEKLRQAEQDVETNWMASIRLAGLINSSALRLRLESLRATTTNDPVVRDQTVKTFPDYRREFTSLIRKYESVVASPEEQSLYDKVRASADRYEGLLNQLEPMLISGDNAAASTLISSTIRPLTNNLINQISDLMDYNDRGAKAAGVLAGEIYDSGLVTIYGLLLAVVTLTILLGYMLVRSVTQPLDEALSIAKIIANKDLSQTFKVSGRDEAAAMLAAISQMQNNLKDTLTHISDSSTQLASAAEEMAAVTEESSRGLVKQNDEVNQAATAVNEMSAAVDEVAVNAAEAADASGRAQQLTKSGLENVKRTLGAIQALSSYVESTGEQIQTLSSRAQDISKVIEVIRAIAEQTNLLALNAAIEAARAGEQGRGFAVVADEVRALAHRTQQSTQEIEQMIGSIQDDSLQAVKAMVESQKMADESTSVAQRASESLEEISHSITMINERNVLIATASEEQAQVAREIDRNLTSIRDLSTQSAAGASQTASASGEVSNLAVGLNRVVQDFKL
ncbi:methyl-accepting chemotaxis protein [Pseudomonas fluorescens]|nr:methyl-accepting chemotaxis protein [Pseudomonas fluorescens]UTL92356.1 methyl-accepting chemotaxis protein [Pseudomonas fluorescens]